MMMRLILALYRQYNALATFAMKTIRRCDTVIISKSRKVYCTDTTVVSP